MYLLTILYFTLTSGYDDGLFNSLIIRLVQKVSVLSVCVIFSVVVEVVVVVVLLVVVVVVLIVVVLVVVVVVLVVVVVVVGVASLIKGALFFCNMYLSSILSGYTSSS